MDAVFESLAIDPAHIDEQLCKVSHELGVVARELAKATGAELRAKSELKKVEADAYLLIQQTAKDSKVRVTVSVIEANVALHQSVQEAQEQLAAATERRKELEGLFEALRVKASVLQVVARRHNQLLAEEMRGGL